MQYLWWLCIMVVLLYATSIVQGFMAFSTASIKQWVVLRLVWTRYKYSIDSIIENWKFQKENRDRWKKPQNKKGSLGWSCKPQIPIWLWLLCPNISAYSCILSFQFHNASFVTGFWKISPIVTFHDSNIYNQSEEWELPINFSVILICSSHFELPGWILLNGYRVKNRDLWFTWPPPAIPSCFVAFYSNPFEIFNFFIVLVYFPCKRQSTTVYLTEVPWIPLEKINTL